jgi:hydrogenase maturation factor
MMRRTVITAMAMSSTGTILAAIDAQAQEEIKTKLSKQGLSACILGEFTVGEDRVLIKTGKRTTFPQAANDPYTLILSGT